MRNRVSSYPWRVNHLTDGRGGLPDGRTRAEDPVISGVVCIAEASRQLGLNPHLVKGLALGLGIEIQKTGRTLVLSARDVERIRQQTRRREVAALLR